MNVSWPGFFGFRDRFSHEISAEFDAIGGLNKSVQNGIGNRGIGHALVPTFNGQLTGCNGRTFLNSAIQDLEEIFLS